jgi:hypothetical protein
MATHNGTGYDDVLYDGNAFVTGDAYDGKGGFDELVLNKSAVAYPTPYGYLSEYSLVGGLTSIERLSLASGPYYGVTPAAISVTLDLDFARSGLRRDRRGGRLQLHRGRRHRR